MVSDTTVEYPDMIGMAFNPAVINVYGKAYDYIIAKVEDKVTGEVYTEKREMFGTSCFFDLHQYIQGSFDSVDIKTLAYEDAAEDTNLGHLFDISVSFYTDDTLKDSFSFFTFFVWGAMGIGERYNGERKLTWFKNYPFTVGIYSGMAGTVKRYCDGVAAADISLIKQAVWNIPVIGLTATNELVVSMDATDTAPSTFDSTFDLTFKAVGSGACKVTCAVNDADKGIYVRWINRHGVYCYWLFERGDESKKVSDDGEFLRNNMMDYSALNGYHGGTGRKQRKIGENTVPICAPLVDSDTFDFLFDLQISPVVDMYMGLDDKGKHKWISVNLAVGTFAKTKKDLQDFVASVVLPETKVQSL